MTISAETSAIGRRYSTATHKFDAIRRRLENTPELRRSDIDALAAILAAVPILPDPPPRTSQAANAARTERRRNAAALRDSSGRAR